MKKIIGLEEQKDTLERRLAAQQQPPPTLGGVESSPADTTTLSLQNQLLHKASYRVFKPFLTFYFRVCNHYWIFRLLRHMTSLGLVLTWSTNVKGFRV